MTENFFGYVTSAVRKLSKMTTRTALIVAGGSGRAEAPAAEVGVTGSNPSNGHLRRAVDGATKRRGWAVDGGITRSV